MTQATKKHNKLIFMILLVLAVFTTLVLYFGIIHKKPSVTASDIKINGVYLPATKTIKPFNLVDHKNQPFTNANLNGRWTMMFFGFTNCGYVCPTTLTELNKMYKALEAELPAKDLPQVVLVTVDPERDTVEKMAEYINAFNSSFTGVRAEEAETIALEKQLNIAAVKMQAEGQGPDHYMINHSAEILMINPRGEVQAYLSFPSKASQMAEDYKLIIAKTKI